LIDIGGQTSLRSSWSQYFVGTSAIILVIDSSDAGRLPLAKAELDKLTQAEVRIPLLRVAIADDVGAEIIITFSVSE
jgi:ADP-ribosylation factor-like protein 5B